MPDDFSRPDRHPRYQANFIDLHVAARLKRRRLQLKLEPQLLDVAIGEASGTVERVEKGSKRLGASQLYNLAVVLGVGVPYFFADDTDEDGQNTADLPATDLKALSEAKRFARAIARISSPEIKHMIADLLKSLVSPKEIPAIAPPAETPARDSPAADASREHWRLPDISAAQGKGAP